MAESTTISARGVTKIGIAAVAALALTSWPWFASSESAWLVANAPAAAKGPIQWLSVAVVAAAGAVLGAAAFVGVATQTVSIATAVLMLVTIGCNLALYLANLTSLVVSPAVLALALVAFGLIAKRERGSDGQPISRVRELVRTKRLDAAFTELRGRRPSTRTIADGAHLIQAFESLGDTAKATQVRQHLARELARGDQPPATSKARPPQSGTPQRMGRYEIEGILGKGAMGAVYLARDARINRSVALKIVDLEQEFDASGLDAVRTRFFQEAESAGRLHHPDIVMVYDASEIDGSAYIAMEYVTGSPLSEFVEASRQLPLLTVLQLMARAAEALAFAHERDVIHRDIKPANLMYDRAADQLKIMDFGVARLSDTVRTRTGLILGTPAYMSPEQLGGEELTGHSDLFSLGVTLYELLIGEVPFKAKSVVEVARMVSTANAIPVSVSRPNVPVSLDQFMVTALAKDPNQRFDDGWRMAEALAQIAREIESEGTAKTASK